MFFCVKLSSVIGCGMGVLRIALDGWMDGWMDGCFEDCCKFTDVSLRRSIY